MPSAEHVSVLLKTSYAKTYPGRQPYLISLPNVVAIGTDNEKPQVADEFPQSTADTPHTQRELIRIECVFKHNRV